LEIQIMTRTDLSFRALIGLVGRPSLRRAWFQCAMMDLACPVAAAMLGMKMALRQTEPPTDLVAGSSSNVWKHSPF
jgi:hypothetical protein